MESVQWLLDSVGVFDVCGLSRSHEQKVEDGTEVVSLAIDLKPVFGVL
jgi:hypothetical protein